MFVSVPLYGQFVQKQYVKVHRIFGINTRVISIQYIRNGNLLGVIYEQLKLQRRCAYGIFVNAAGIDTREYLS